MKNGKSTGFACFLRDCRCLGRQTVGNGSPFNPNDFLALGLSQAVAASTEGVLALSLFLLSPS
jgi:hypothetical protein